MVVVCDRCGEGVRNRYQLVEVRTELRALSSLRRLRTWRTSLVCRSCAEALAHEHDHPHGAGSEQQGLW